MIGRLLHKSDFERVLAVPPCSRSSHFAVHYLRTRPSRAASTRELTGYAQAIHRSRPDSVDNRLRALAGPGDPEAACGTIGHAQHAAPPGACGHGAACPAAAPGAVAGASAPALCEEGLRVGRFGGAAQRRVGELDRLFERAAHEGACSPPSSACRSALCWCWCTATGCCSSPGWAMPAASSPPARPMRCRRWNGMARPSAPCWRRPRAALPPLVRRRLRPGACAGSPTVHATRPWRARTHSRQEEAHMTDMRRTLLWVVFTMSLVLLWDKWTVHTGQPSMFGGSPRPVGHRRGQAARSRAGGRRADAQRGRRCPVQRRRHPPAAATLPAPHRGGGRQREDHAHHRRRQGHLRQPGRHAGAAGTAGLQGHPAASLVRAFRRPVLVASTRPADAERGAVRAGRQARVPGADRADHRAARRDAAEPPDGR